MLTGELVVLLVLLLCGACLEVCRGGGGCWMARLAGTDACGGGGGVGPDKPSWEVVVWLLCTAGCVGSVAACRGMLPLPAFGFCTEAPYAGSVPGTSAGARAR